MVANGYSKQIRERIDSAADGTIFVNSDFVDVTDPETVRRNLNRLTQAGILRRILKGVYEKPKYSKLLEEYVAADPDAVAKALARSYHWTIAPCGNTALNLLGLSTQVTAVWSYISDGPYKTYEWNSTKLEFKHRTNLAQKPDATQLKDFDGWKDAGASIKRQQKGISILEPGEEYEREDGSIGTSYNVKRVFDISQTTARAKAQPSVSMDDRLLLKALISRPTVPIQMVDDLPNHMGALYDHDQQVVFVRRGMDAADIFRSVSKELAHAEIAAVTKDYTREGAAFAAYSVSYMLCREYGIDASGYDFSRLPDSFRESDAQSIRAVLSEIRDTAGNISSRMNRALEQNRQPKSKEQER